LAIGWRCSPEEIVAAFNKAEEIFGTSGLRRLGFILVHGVAGHHLRFALSTIGQQLACLDGAGGIEELIGKLQANDASAFSLIDSRASR